MALTLIETVAVDALAWTFTGPVNAGDVAVVLVAINESGSYATPDTTGWIDLGGALSGAGSGASYHSAAGYLVCRQLTAGQTSLSFPISGTPGAVGVVASLLRSDYGAASGLSNVPSADGTATSSGTDFIAPSAATLTTIAADCAVIAWSVAEGATGSLTVTAGTFTLLASAAIGSQYQHSPLQVAAGTSVTITAGGSGPRAAGAAAIVPWYVDSTPPPTPATYAATGWQLWIID